MATGIACEKQWGCSVHLATEHQARKSLGFTASGKTVFTIPSLVSHTPVLPLVLTGKVWKGSAGNPSKALVPWPELDIPIPGFL